MLIRVAAQNMAYVEPSPLAEFHSVNLNPQYIVYIEKMGSDLWQVGTTDGIYRVRDSDEMVLRAWANRDDEARL